MKGAQTLEAHLYDFLNNDKRKASNQKLELFIIKSSADCISVTDDFIHYFEIQGKIFLI